MYRITKEMCLTFLKHYYKSRIIFLLLASVILLVLLCSFLCGSDYSYISVFVCIILLCAYVATLFVYVLKAKRNLNSINTVKLYLVEDTVVKFKKRFRFGNPNGASYSYSYEFSEYGKHRITKSIYPTFEISSKKEKHISHSTVDNLSIESNEKGDLFYLLICDEAKKKTIIKCFYKYYFDVKEDDFEYLDGKYYCRIEQTKR